MSYESFRQFGTEIPNEFGGLLHATALIRSGLCQQATQHLCNVGRIAWSRTEDADIEVSPSLPAHLSMNRKCKLCNGLLHN